MTFLRNISPTTSTQAHDGATTLGAYLHVLMPALIVAAALVLHALHNALPLFTLVALVSAAYGRLAWHDFIQSKMVTGSITDSVTTERDVTLGVEPTR